MPIGLDRLLLSLAVLTAFTAAAKVLGVVNRRAVQSRSGGGSLLGRISRGTPTLLYFWTEDCAPCVFQERQIERAKSTLARRGRKLRVQKVNALEEADLARSMNVMTVPTTVLLDARGNVVSWNAGLREARQLISQAERIFL